MNDLPAGEKNSNTINQSPPSRIVSVAPNLSPRMSDTNPLHHTNSYELEHMHSSDSSNRDILRSTDSSKGWSVYNDKEEVSHHLPIFPHLLITLSPSLCPLLSFCRKTEEIFTLQLIN